MGITLQNQSYPLPSHWRNSVPTTGLATQFVKIVLIPPRSW